jgi:hypothetical protein
MIDYKRLHIADIAEFEMEPDAIWWSCPDGMKHSVEKFSPLGGCQASLRWLPVFRAKSGGGEGLKRALRLRSEDACAAGDLGN